MALGWSVLGLACRAAGDAAGAVAACAEAVRLHKAHGHETERLANGYNNHAMALRALGRQTGDRALLEQARALDEQALALREDVLGPDSEEVASSLANLAVSHNALGDRAEAFAASNRALAIRRKLVAAGEMPAKDTRLGTSLNNHGADLLRDGQAGAARGLLAEALALRRAAFGRDDHPDVRTTADWLVLALLVLARRGDAAAEAEARDLCGRFGFDLERWREIAAHFPDPR